MGCGSVSLCGRAQEVYSEDVKLTADLTVGFVTGAQGSSPAGVQEEKELLTVACCKHLAACACGPRARVAHLLRAVPMAVPMAPH